MKTKAPLPPVERLRLLLRELCHGNQRHLAKLLGCSPATITLILKNQRTVSDRVLQSLAAIPGVSSEWAITGNGPWQDPTTTPVDPPTKASVLSSRDTYSLAPVYTAPLPGSPARHLAGRIAFVAVAPEEPSPSLYWIKIPERSPLIEGSSWGIRGNDMLLIETDPEKYPSFHDVDFQLCVVTLKESTKSLCELGEVSVEYESGGLEFRAPKPRARAPSKRFPQPNFGIDIEHRQIVGVALRLVRDFRWGSFPILD